MEMRRQRGEAEEAAEQRDGERAEVQAELDRPRLRYEALEAQMTDIAHLLHFTPAPPPPEPQHTPPLPTYLSLTYRGPQGGVDGLQPELAHLRITYSTATANSHARQAALHAERDDAVQRLTASTAAHSALRADLDPLHPVEDDRGGGLQPARPPHAALLPPLRRSSSPAAWRTT